MNPFRSLLLLFTCVLYLSSCQKEIDFDNAGQGTNTGGNTGGNNNNNASCNDVLMKLKRYQALVDPSVYIEASWNSNGTIQSIAYNDYVSPHLTATYVYENGRIKEAALHTNYDNQVYDTAVFHYNTHGKVDSMYLKNNDSRNYALSYINDKLASFTLYSGTSKTYYWNITTDAKDNISTAVDYWSETTGFVKQSTTTYTRDDRKNPFAGLAPYMFYLDDEYIIFRYWGANNYIDERIQDHSGSGIDLTTGNKFKYNENCYPSSLQITLMGQVLFTDDDYSYTYY